jgi:uncharacterized protein
VDAAVRARAGSTVERHFSAAELPRLREAGGHEGSSIEVNFQFAQFDGRPTVSGQLRGVAVLTCQRCMQPVTIEVDDSFQLLIVEQERSDEPGGYEPVVAEAARLDLRWLAEDQVLLAMPLVPLHEDPHCADALIAAGSATEETAQPLGDDAVEVRQQPFKNLRDLLRKQ